MYIQQHLRGPIDEHVDPVGEQIRTPGELAYAIARLCEIYSLHRPPSYYTGAEITGVLETVKQELFQTNVGPLLAQKLLDHGGIFDDPSSGGLGRPDLSDAAEGSTEPSVGALRTAVAGGTR